MQNKLINLAVNAKTLAELFVKLEGSEIEVTGATMERGRVVVSGGDYLVLHIGANEGTENADLRIMPYGSPVFYRVIQKGEKDSRDLDLR